MSPLRSAHNRGPPDLVRRLVLDNIIFPYYIYLYYDNSERIDCMPELSRFEGMVIKLLFNDTVQHNKPQVHVYCG